MKGVLLSTQLVVAVADATAVAGSVAEVAVTHLLEEAGGGGFGRGFNGGCGNPSRGGNNNSIDKRPTCQVCKKKGHNADWCCHRFDEEYVPRRGLLRWPLVTTAGTLILELWIT
jgi:hypothetical protein